MKQGIPWSRHAAEVIVIVGSILLAFAIDAWWDGRQESIQETETLQFVLDNVRVDISEANNRLESGKIDQLVLQEFYASSPTELTSVSRERASQIFNALYRANTFDASQNSISGLINSGRSNIVRDRELKASFERWSSLVTEIQERAEAITDISTLVVVALGRHDAYRSWNLRLDRIEIFTLDLRAVQSDEDVLAKANGIYVRRRVHMRFLTELRDNLLEIEKLIKNSLDLS